MLTTANCSLFNLQYGQYLAGRLLLRIHISLNVIMHAPGLERLMQPIMDAPMIAINHKTQSPQQKWLFFIHKIS